MDYCYEKIRICFAEYVTLPTLSSPSSFVKPGVTKTLYHKSWFLQSSVPMMITVHPLLWALVRPRWRQMTRYRSAFRFISTHSSERFFPPRGRHQLGKPYTEFLVPISQDQSINMAKVNPAHRHNRLWGDKHVSLVRARPRAHTDRIFKIQ